MVVFEISAEGGGVGYPGTSAKTNCKAGLSTDPIVLVASTFTLIVFPVNPAPKVIV